jgi:Ca-activated chloride channel family protein
MEFTVQLDRRCVQSDRARPVGWVRGLSAAVAVVLMLAGCSHGTSASSSGIAATGSAFDSTARSAAGAAGGATAGGEAVGGGAVGSGAVGGGATSSALTNVVRATVRTASISIQAADTDRAADRVLSLIGASGRVESDERRMSDSGGARVAHIVLRVPPNSLEAVLAGVAAAGHELSRSLQSDDVTATQADVTARVAALTSSVIRLRELMSKSASVADLVTLETTLSQRESDKESIAAQQRALADQIELARVTVDISASSAASRAHRAIVFGSAFARGWHALLRAGRLLLAGVGFGLPWAPLVVLALVAGRLALRTRHRRHGPSAADADPGPNGAAADPATG